jgi:hypothetical protein
MFTPCGRYAGTSSALTQLTLISEFEHLDLDERDGFVLAAMLCSKGSRQSRSGEVLVDDESCTDPGRNARRLPGRRQTP